MARGIVFTLAVWLILPIIWSGCAQHARTDHARPLQIQNLEREIERKLIQEARHVRGQGRVQESLHLLERFVANYPRSSLQDEAYWELAQAHQQAENHRKALDYYRMLVRTGQEQTNRDRAKRHILELEKKFAALSVQHRSVQGFLVPRSILQQRSAVEQLLQEATRTPITTYVLKIGCALHDWKELIRTRGGHLITQAHARQQTVLAAVNLRCMGTTQMSHQWRDRSYDPVTMKIHPSRFFDLFHFGYQQYLVELLRELAQIGIDGFVFQAHTPLGPLEGFTPSAIHAFQESFQVRFLPQDLFNIHHASQALLLKSNPIEVLSEHQVLSPLFWQWSGWKTREQLRIMTKISEQVARQFPLIQFGKEVHELSIRDPLSALIAYSEDWVDMGRSQFDFFVVQQPRRDVPTGNQASGQSSASVEDFSFHAMVNKMVQFLDDPQKLWVMDPHYAESRSAHHPALGR